MLYITSPCGIPGLLTWLYVEHPLIVDRNRVANKGFDGYHRLRNGHNLTNTRENATALKRLLMRFAEMHVLCFHSVLTKALLDSRLIWREYVTPSCSLVNLPRRALGPISRLQTMIAFNKLGEKQIANDVVQIRF